MDPGHANNNIISKYAFYDQEFYLKVDGFGLYVWQGDLSNIVLSFAT